MKMVKSPGPSRWFLGCGLLALVAAAAPAGAEVTYTLTDLQTLGGAAANAAAINNNGVVVGNSRNALGQVRAFRYDGAMHDLGTLGGNTAYATAINSTGQIAGTSNDGSKDLGFRYTSSTMSSIGSTGNKDSSYANAINNNGVIAGTTYDNAQGYAHAIVQTGASSPVQLGMLPTGQNSSAQGINTNGVIVGYADDSNWLNHAFLYDGTMHDLGTMGGAESYANAINDAGQIVGASHNAAGTFHAFLYSGGLSGAWTDLQDLTTGKASYSEAFAINSLGQVVGTSNWNGAGTHAFIWQNGQMLDLNTLIAPGSGLTLVTARGINDSGDIVGTAVDSNNINHAFLLTHVPEPGSAMLLLLPALALRRRRTQSPATFA